MGYNVQRDVEGKIVSISSHDDKTIIPHRDVEGKTTSFEVIEPTPEKTLTPEERTFASKAVDEFYEKTGNIVSVCMKVLIIFFAVVGFISLVIEFGFVGAFEVIFKFITKVVGGFFELIFGGLIEELKTIFNK